MKTALVIIDMQNGFMNEYTKWNVDPIVQIADSFDYVIGTRYINHLGTACYRFEGWKDCMVGTESVELVDEIKEICDVVIDKDKYSCWNSEFVDYIRDNNIGRIMFVGVNTACCVLASVFDTYNNLIDSYVIASLCASTNGTESHLRGLEVLRETITKDRVIGVTDVQSLLEDNI